MRSKLAAVAGFLVLVAAAIGIMIYLDHDAPAAKAEDRVQDVLRASRGGDREAALVALDGVVAAPDWDQLGDATRAEVGAQIVRVAASRVSAPFTRLQLDSATRVVTRFHALPPAAQAGAARELMQSTLEGWLAALTGPADREARITLLRLELGVAGARDTLQTGQRLATARLELARSIADAWPVDALGLLSEEPRDPSAIPDGMKLLARLAEQPALLVDAGTDVDAWLASLAPTDPLRQRVEAQRTLGRAAHTEDEADLTAAQLASKLAERPWDQWIAVKLASQELGTGHAKEAEARLRAMGSPGMLIRSATFVLAQIAMSRGQLEAADQLISGLLGARLQRFLAATTALEDAVKSLQSRLEVRLRAGNLPADLLAKLPKASEADQRAMVQRWVLEEMGQDPDVKARREAVLAFEEVVPASILAGTVKLRRAQAESGPRRAELLADAERAFLAVRGAAEGQPEFHLGLGEIYARLGKAKESDAEFQGVLDRKDPALMLRVANTYRSLGGMRRATEIAKEIQRTANAPYNQTAASLLGVMADTEEEREAWYRKGDQTSVTVRTALLEIEGRRLMREGKHADCDRKFAESAKLNLEGASATDPIGFNNAAIATQQRFLCTGDLAVLHEAAAGLERAYQLISDEPILVANIAAFLASEVDLRILAKRIDLRAIRPGGSDAQALLDALRGGAERAAIRAELVADPSWSRSRAMFAQYAVLAPASLAGYVADLGAANRMEDDDAAEAVLARLRAATQLDTSEADRQYQRELSGEANKEVVASLAGSLRDDDERLAAKLDPKTRAAALLLHALHLQSHGMLTQAPAELVAAREARAQAEALWPVLVDRATAAHARLDEAGLALAPEEWSKRRRVRSAASVLERLEEAKDPLAAQLRASPAWAEITALLHAATGRPSIDDLRLARLAGDAAAVAWAAKVTTNRRARTEVLARKILMPADPRAAEDLAELAAR